MLESTTALILVWGIEGDDIGYSAARLIDMLEQNLPKTDYYPVTINNGYISIRAGYDCPVEPLQIMTPKAFIEMYATPGRLPEPGEVLEEVREEKEDENDKILVSTLMLACNHGTSPIPCSKHATSAVRYPDINPPFLSARCDSHQGLLDDGRTVEALQSLTQADVLILSRTSHLYQVQGA